MHADLPGAEAASRLQGTLETGCAPLPWYTSIAGGCQVHRLQLHSAAMVLSAALQCVKQCRKRSQWHKNIRYCTIFCAKCTRSRHLRTRTVHELPGQKGQLTTLLNVIYSLSVVQRLCAHCRCFAMPQSTAEAAAALAPCDYRTPAQPARAGSSSQCPGMPEQQTETAHIQGL